MYFRNYGIFFLMVVVSLVISASSVDCVERVFSELMHYTLNGMLNSCLLTHLSTIII